MRGKWPKSGTPDRPMSIIGYPLNTQSRNDSGRHLTGRNHTASERSRMFIGCTGLWRNKSSCTRLSYKPPDYGRTTRPPAHTHIRTRSGRKLAPRHEAGHYLFFRLGALLFPELFFVHHEDAVSTPTHKVQKRIYADGLDIDHRLPGHGHGTRRAEDSHSPFQMAQGDMFVAWRAREMYFPPPVTSQHQRQPIIHKISNTTQHVHEYNVETPHLIRSTAVYRTAEFWPLQN